MTITIYSKYNCQPCRLTKAFLERNDLPYTEYNVEDDTLAYERVQEMGYQSVPVLVVDDQSWSGMRPDKLQALVS